MAAVLGLIVLAGGSWFAAHEFLNRSHDNGASAASSSRSTSQPSASSAASSAPSSSSSTDSAEKQDADYLKAQADADLGGVDLDAGDYVPRLATLWVGQTTPEHPNPYTSSEIKTEYDGYKQRFGNVKLVLSNKVGRQSSRVTAHPDAYIIYVDTHFSSGPDAQGWCQDNMSGDQNACAPQALNHPHP